MTQKILMLVIHFFLLMGMLMTQPSKVVLIEEGTGTWCAWCPEGSVVGKKLLRAYPGRVIFIEVHGNDPMEDETYDAASGFWSYPSGHINRITDKMHLEPRQWEGALIQELDKIPSANVHVETIYDTLSRNLTVNITAEFFETLTGDYRLAAIVLEDAVTGDDEKYGQSNVFADNKHGFMGGFEILPSYIPPDLMVYDHVGRHLLGSYDGALGSLPEEVIAGNTYMHSFNWILPSDYNRDYVWITGLLINNDNGAIINAGKSKYLSGSENAKPFFMSEPLVRGHTDYLYNYSIRYHDSNDDAHQIEVVTPIPEWLQFEKGRTGFAALKGIPTDAGNYDITLRLTDAEYMIEQTFQITIEDSIPPPILRVSNDFLILPNPNRGVFEVEFDKGTDYQVLDASGKSREEGKLVRNIYDPFFVQSINLKHLGAGLYFLRIYDSNGHSKTKKLWVYPE